MKSFKYKLSEQELPTTSRGGRFKVGDVKIKSGTKYTVRDIDPETGSISWKIEDVPAVDSTFKEFKELKDFLNKLDKDTDDLIISKIRDEVMELFNQYRTHIRKNYPDAYKKFQTNEISTSAGAGAYLTKYAFSKNKKAKIPKYLYKLGFKPVNEGDTYEKMAAKGKKSGNLKQGTVRKRLGIKKGEKIPLSTINKEISRLKKMDQDKDIAGVQLGDKNKKYYKALQLSKTLKTTTNVKETKSVGSKMGPGPKAGPKGVKDNYYVKKFGYKLVDRKKLTKASKGVDYIDLFGNTYD